MITLQSPALTAALALASMFLALSLLVQILQELYKYLRSSKARAYENELIDFLGPWAKSILTSGSPVDIRVRGPLQWRKLRPKGYLLPLNKKSFVDALQRTTSPWVQQTIQHLSLEEDLRSGKRSPPTENWTTFLQSLSNAEEGSPDYLSANAIAGFLKDWNHTWKPERVKVGKPGNHPSGKLGEIKPLGTIDAAAMLKAFRVRFLPDVDRAANNFEQFEKNFDYTYRRMNVRLTFSLALLVAIVGNLSIERLWTKATSMDPETAAAYAENVLQLSQEVARLSGPGDSVAAARVAIAKSLVGRLAPDTVTTASPARLWDIVDTKSLAATWSGGFWSVLGYLLGCLLTAVLVTFGAPIWNDLASALLRLQKSAKSSPAPAAKEGG
jgi:hypothetical protein